MNINLFNIVALTLLIVIVFTGFNMVGGEISSNSNLDDQSKTIITNTQQNLYSNFNSSEFTQNEINISVNTSFDNVDPFARAYLEEQSNAQQNTNLYQNFRHIPTLIKDSLGISDSLFSPWWGYVISFVSLILIVTGFVLFFGRGKINN